MMETLSGLLVVVLALVSTLSAGLESPPKPGVLSARLWSWALLVNLVLVPTIAVAVARLGPLVSGEPSADVEAGLVIGAAIPGGSTGPIIASLTGGNLAVAGTVFAGVALLGGLLVPFGAMAAGLSLSTGAVLLLIAVQLGPWALGRWLRHARPAIAARLGPPVKRVGGPLLLALIAALLIAKGGSLGTLGVWPLFASLVVVVASWALGASSPGPRDIRIGLGAVASVRNLTLALLVATAAEAPPATLLAILLFGLVMYLVPAGVLGVARLHRRASEGPGTHRRD